MKRKATILLSGKETKATLIKLLIDNKARCQGVNSDVDELFFKDYSKLTLLACVKLFNANVAAGGDGNISPWSNEEAYSYYKAVSDRIMTLLGNHGITTENLRQHISMEKGDQMRQKWEEGLKTTYNGCVGHEEAEQESAFQFLKQLFQENLPTIKL